MSNIIDFSNATLVERYYGGNAGSKLSINYEDDIYMIKFPKSTKELQRSVQLSYTNTPLSEYVGSKIYESLSIPVHKTMLGIRNEKIVVACKDFLNNGDRLEEFKNIKNHYIEDVSSSPNFTGGEGTNLYEVLEVMDKNPTLRHFGSKVVDRFWDMFVVDMLIANSDRNNGNWGVIFRTDGTKELAPVYDNGNSFNPKSSDEQLLKALSSNESLAHSAYVTRVCAYKDEFDKPMKAHEVISSLIFEDCNKAVLRINNSLDVGAVKKIIYDIPNEYNGYLVATDVQKEYMYKSFMVRKEAIFDVALNKIPTEKNKL